MSELAAIIVALTALLGLLGGGMKFLWNKVEARFVEIDKKLAECEAREKASQSRSSAHVTVIELLWQEVERLSSGGSKALHRASKLLNDLKEGH